MSSLYLMTDVDRVRIGLLVFSLLVFAFSVPIALPHHVFSVRTECVQCRRHFAHGSRVGPAAENNYTVTGIWEALFGRMRPHKLTAHLPKALDHVGASVVTSTVDPRGCFSAPGSASPRFEQKQTSSATNTRIKRIEDVNLQDECHQRCHLYLSVRYSHCTFLGGGCIVDFSPAYLDIP